MDKETPKFEGEEGRKELSEDAEGENILFERVHLKEWLK
jgi:hypothetical protein